MNWMQLHLVLNHFPIVGTAIGTGVLAWGAVNKKPELLRIALWVLASMTFLAVPVYLSGLQAAPAAENLSGVSPADIEAHEDAAALSLAGCVFLCITAIMNLLLYRKRGSLPAPSLGIMLALALVCTVLLVWTGHRGGEIRHPEIRGAFVQHG